MTDNADNMQNDEIILIDFLLGQLPPEEAQLLRARMQAEPELRKLHDNLANTFAAMDLAPQPQAPAGLAERTLARIAAAERTDTLIAMEQRAARPFRPTFSLRELAAMVAIMLVAVGMILPALRLAHHRGLRSECAAQLGQIGSAMQTYALNNAGLLPGTDGDATRWGGHGPGARASNSASLFKLLRQKYLALPTVFQCPAVGGASFTIKPGMADFPQAQHISYSYNYSLGGHRVSILTGPAPPVASSMVILGDQTPLFAPGQFQPGKLSSPVSENHAGPGHNVLYLAGQVLWATTSNVGVDSDDIFLVQGVESYTGNEKPASITDTFLLPAYAANRQR